MPELKIALVVTNFFWGEKLGWGTYQDDKQTLSILAALSIKTPGYLEGADFNSVSSSSASSRSLSACISNSIRCLIKAMSKAIFRILSG
jgi:hypothetical protein